MRHVYVHVPFCRRRCTYCDFAIAVRRLVPAAAFVDAVLRELDLALGDPERVAGAVEPIETLYLGGGTPSLLPPPELDRLLHGLRDRLGRAPDAEVTLEANPDDVTDAAVDAWLAAGINRVSVGVQSTDERVLTWMHRTHRGPDGPGAIARLVRRGMPRVSADLIFGLPDALHSDPLETCRQLEDVGVGHLSAYGLTVEPATALAKREARGGTERADPDRYAREFLALHERLTGRGFRHYEVSNYAAADDDSRHNRCYWEGRAYLGLGPSAHSHRAGVRWWNVAQWAEYGARLAAGLPVVGEREALSVEQRRLERIYLALRQDGGLPEDAAEIDPAAVTRAREAGWIRCREGRLVCTPEGWLRLDALVVGLTTSARGG